jgi:hypothetical protein
LHELQLTWEQLSPSFFPDLDHITYDCHSNVYL